MHYYLAASVHCIHICEESFLLDAHWHHSTCIHIGCENRVCAGANVPEPIFPGVPSVSNCMDDHQYHAFKPRHCFLRPATMHTAESCADYSDSPRTTRTVPPPRSLIVNYHCEASNHGRGNSTKRLFSPSTHSRFMEVLSESINFAAQGLCEGTPVVSRSCRCSEQIGCIFE